MPKEHQITSKVGYPMDATFVTGSGTAAAGASNSQTLAGAVGLTTYLTKAIFTADFVSAKVSGVCTLTDGTWTLNFRFVDSESAGGFMNLDFADSPLVASATNTAITATIPVITGGGATAIALIGYQR